jgi:transposase-like protein
MKCPKCAVDRSVKAGQALKKQRYQCKGCGCKFTRSTPKGAGASFKRQALHMYLEGVGMRSIGRLLRISHVAVYKWLRAAGESVYIKHLRGYEENTVKVMELDELRTYIRSKKTTSGSGWLMIETGNGPCPLRWVPGNTARG